VNNSTEVQFKDDPRTTIADEEEHEFSYESTNECEDYFKEFNDENAA
jgi:hypothetical protein